MATNMLSKELYQSFPVGDVHFDPEFHQAVVDHFPYFRENPRFVGGFTPEAYIAARYRGDFYGLLAENKIDPRYHQILTEFNGMSKSSDYDGQVRRILVLQVEFIEEKILKPFLSRTI